ncbi:MAG: nicotinamide riboside kinase [Bacteroidia bacterium]|jgi:nicotinamide riboside kinase
MESRPQIFACVGPESTGKTTLCHQLANHFGGYIVPEFAREFLNQTKGKYEKSDLLTIAKGQFELERDVASNSKDLVFSDTDVLVVKVWHEFKYQELSPEIDEVLNNQSPRKYLLAYPDLDWKPDPLRENPSDLLEIFNFYEKTLNEIGAEFKVIRGTGNERLNSAIDAINQMKLD